MESSLKSGVCPKCGLEEVYGEFRDYSKILPSRFGLDINSNRPNVENYVCGICGYAEFYVITEHLGKVKKGWERIPKK